MNREKIIKLSKKNIEYDNLEKAKNILEKNYDISYGNYEPGELKEIIKKGSPVIIKNNLIIGFDPSNPKKFINSNKEGIEIERMVKAIVVEDEIEPVEDTPSDLFVIINKFEWDNQYLNEFMNIFGDLRVGAIFLPPHSAIFNFLSPTPEQKEAKIVSMLEGVNINIYDNTNYIDNAIHEIGHLYYRDRLIAQERKAFDSFYNRLKPSAIYEFLWEKSTPEEVFCTVYKWYLKSILINKAFYNILEFEEPEGLDLLQKIFDRVSQDQKISGIWEMNKAAVFDYLNPVFDKTTLKYLRKAGSLETTKTTDIPREYLDDIVSYIDGIEFIQLEKAVVPVKDNRIDVDNLHKARKMPVGTVSKGYKKVAEGKWVKVKQDKEKPVDQTQTPEFKKWFGNSKVVDQNGKPLVVYHGTQGDFNEFDLGKTGSNNDPGMWGEGFYFSPIKSFSKSYGNNIIKVYLSIKKPFIVKKASSLPSELKPVTTIEGAKKLRNKLIELGYDGVIQYETTSKDENGKLTQIIAFFPNQIKSATGNRGTFDPNSADMTKAITTNPFKENFIIDSSFSHYGKDKIYVDLDGVVADFSGKYQKVFNRSSFEDDRFTVQQHCLTVNNFFRDLDVIPKGRELVDALKDSYKIVFLTTPMADDMECKRDKLEWVRDNFGPEYDVIFSSSKEDYVIDEQSVLIDDMDYNLKPWEEAGGTAINFNKKNEKILAIIEDVFNDKKHIEKVREQLDNMVVDADPSEAQKESGNYKKGEIFLKGLRILVENPKNSIRWGVGFNGQRWITKMKAHYGYITGFGDTMDGDKIDVFIGDKLNASRCFIVNQVNPDTGMFDEHKVVMAVDNINEAEDLYMSCYQKGWKGLGSIVQLNTKLLREWLSRGNFSEPYKRELISA